MAQSGAEHPIGVGAAGSREYARHSLVDVGGNR
jgi:hypothetical protein